MTVEAYMVKGDIKLENTWEIGNVIVAAGLKHTIFEEAHLRERISLRIRLH